MKVAARTNEADHIDDVVGCGFVVVTEQTEQLKHLDLDERVRNIAHHTFRFAVPADYRTKTLHEIGNHFAELWNVVGCKLQRRNRELGCYKMR